MTKELPDGSRFDLSKALEALQDPEEHVRIGALAGLITSRTRGQALIERVTLCLDDPLVSARELAVVVLAQVGLLAVPSLLQALDEGQPLSVRLLAASVLGELGGDAALAIDSLCRCLKSQDERLRWHASFALGRMGGVSTPSLREMLNSPDLNVRAAAVDGLGWIGPGAEKAVEDLKTLSLSESPLLRLACLSSLVKITSVPSAGLPMLIEALQHTDETVRRNSVERIGDLDEAALEAIPDLLDCLQDPSGPVRAAAALAIVRTKTDDTEAVASLIPLLKDPDPEVRISAGISLGTIGPAAAPALPALRRMEAVEDQRTAGTAKAAIQRIEGGS